MHLKQHTLLFKMPFIFTAALFYWCALKSWEVKSNFMKRLLWEALSWNFQSLPVRYSIFLYSWQYHGLEIHPESNPVQLRGGFVLNCSKLRKHSFLSNLSPPIFCQLETRIAYTVKEQNTIHNSKNTLQAITSLHFVEYFTSLTISYSSSSLTISSS